jgi:arylsulfatase A-like enzyme
MTAAPREQNARGIVERLPVIPTLLVIVVLGGALRLYLLGSASLWYDEGASLFLRRFADLQGSLLDQSKTTEAPLMAIFARAWYGGLGDWLGLPRISEASDFFIRLLPCLFSIAVIPMLFLLARRLTGNPLAALIAAFLFAISPYHIYYAQEFRIYSFFTLAGLFAFYAMVRAVEDDDLRWWAAMAASFVVLIYAHFVAVFYIFAFSAAYVLTTPKHGRRIVRWTVWNFAALMLMVPAIYLAHGMDVITRSLKYAWMPPPTTQTLVITVKNWFAGYALVPAYYWALLLFAGLCFALGLVALCVRGRWTQAVWITVMTALPLVLGYLRWNYGDFSFYEHRIYTLSGAIVLIGAGVGLATFPGRYSGLLGLALFTVLTAPCLRAYYQRDLHPIDEHRFGIWDKVDLRGAAACLETRLQPGDLVGHLSHFTMYSMFHYLPEARHLRLGAYPEEAQVFTETMGNPAMLEAHGLMPVFAPNVLGGVKRVWLLETHGITFEYKPTASQLLAWFRRQWHEVERHDFDGLTLYCFEPGTPLAAGPRPPNIVFILLDTLRADRVQATRSGVEVMPYLNRLSRESLYFPRAITPCSWTKPTIASLFTGLSMDEHGVVYGVRKGDSEQPATDVLAAALLTLPEWLRDRGYATFCVQTNGNLRAELGFAQGFAPEDYVFLSSVPGQQVSDLALERLAQKQAPYFLYAHYMDVHAPYDLRPGHTELFQPPVELTAADRSILANYMPFFWDELHAANGRPRSNNTPRLSEAGRATVLARYDGECHYLDEQVRNLIETLKQRDPNTLFIVTADHGEEFWEHDGVGHGWTLYKDNLEVPLIMHGPGILPEIVHAAVPTQSLPATIAGIVAPDEETPFRGHNLLGTREVPEIYAITRSAMAGQGIALETLIQGQQKYIEDHGRGISSLFLLDASEKPEDNLLRDNPALAHPFRLRLSELRAAHRAFRAGIATEASPLDAQEQEQLRSLGYLDADAAAAAHANTQALSEEQQRELEAIGYLDSTPPEASPPLPNIVLLVIDTLRADRLHGTRNGVPIMPHLSALAKQAWDFQHAVTQATWTKPATTSLLTGLYPETHNVQFGVQQTIVPGQRGDVQVLPDIAPYAPAYFAGMGYTTLGFQTNQHLQCKHGFGRGFGADCAAYSNMPWANADQVTDAGIAALKTVKGPFFLYMHYFDPHAVYAPPQAYSAVFGDLPGFTESDAPLLDPDFYGKHYYLDRMRVDLGIQAEREFASFSDQGRESLRHLYDGECRFADTEVQRLIDFLDTRHPNTILVITSDHGEEFWEHGSIGHAKTVYEELSRVPLIIRIPKAERRTVTAPVETIDILPTLAAVIGAKPDPAWQGRDLGNISEARPVFTQTRGSIPEFQLHLESVTDGPLKLILNRHHCGGRPPEELYDLANDPGEQRNLVERAPEQAQRLRALLEAHAKAAGDGALPSVQAQIDEETAAQLEALGYLDAGTAPKVPCLNP